MPDEREFKASAPGKIYLIGEYSVLEGCPAFIAALDRGVEATYRLGEKGEPEGELVSSAIATASAYVTEGNIPFKEGSISLVNGLVDAEGHKIGLGSSGAICAAVVHAILKAHSIEPSVSLLYRLASIAEANIQPDGSFGDVAAAACGGFFEYSHIDSDWLGSHIATTPVRALVESRWPTVTATRYPWPANLHLLLGWTREEASTSSLVKKFKVAKTKKKKEFQTFIDASNQAASMFRKALDRGDSARICEAIRLSRDAVRAFSNAAEMSLYTKKLNKLVKLAERCGATAKPSGSWGGDCGYAICDSQEQIEAVCAEWEKAGIEPLRLEFAPAKFNI